MKSVFIGCGAYLPSNSVSNDDLSKMVDTSDDWIVARTGISNRYIAADDELTSDLAYNAAVDALASAEITAEDRYKNASELFYGVCEPTQQAISSRKLS